MEVLAKTEYQDLYRVTDGVLLVVNKFVPIKYENEKYFSVRRRGVKQGKYNKGCQDWLKILKEDYYDEYWNLRRNIDWPEIKDLRWFIQME